MKKQFAIQGGAEIEQAADAGLETMDINLACALVTMDFEMTAQAGKIVAAGKSRPDVTFHFAAKSRCGNYAVGDLIKHWHEGEAFIERQPEHKWAYVMATLSNRIDLLKLVHEMPTHHLLRHGKSAVLISDKADSKTQTKLLGGGR